MLAGGGAFNNLDYSFTVGHEDGTGANSAPGSGSKELRRQLGVLRRILESAPLAQLHPDYVTVVHAPEVLAQTLSTPDRHSLLIYLEGKGPCEVEVDIPTGRYEATWIDPLTGGAIRQESITHPGGHRMLSSPGFKEDIALRLSPPSL